MGRLRAWAMGHWLRSIIIAATLLILTGVTIGGWAYLASVALKAGEPTAAQALLALDEGKYEEARGIVTRILSNSNVPASEYGVPLLVLGSIKMHDAEQQAMSDRRRIEYLIASRYLAEARAYGLPGVRELQGAYLHGKSLVESGEYEEGERILRDMIDARASTTHPLRNDALWLLANTCLIMPQPRLKEALHYNDMLVAVKDLPENNRINALLQRADCLARLGNYPEAKQTIASIPTRQDLVKPTSLRLGTIILDEVEATLEKLPVNERQQAATKYEQTISGAIDILLKSTPQNEQKDRAAAAPMYQIGRALALRGELKEALEQFQRLRQQHEDTEEGLAALLGEARIRRQLRDFDDALPAYRHALELYATFPNYRSPVLPVEQIRKEIVQAQTEFMQNKHYGEAFVLLDHLVPLFDRSEQLDLRGRALESWGNELLSQSPNETGEPTADQAAGFEKLRAAGVAFEQLASLRFATKSYTTDLWRAGEDFFLGQCYSRAVLALQNYLKYEPELRNAQALLRLGQAQLALGKIPESITAFEECVEFHPADTAAFQARLDCARAYWRQGNTDRAEGLLRDNIVGSALKPSSQEWKDSLFELGMLLHQKEKFEDAIYKLEEAVDRYPQDQQSLTAKYVIGECYRRWAQDAFKESQQTRAGSEHNKWVQHTTDRLNAALHQFEDVQRMITLKTHDIHGEPLMGAMLRNCYMQEGAVLFDLATLAAGAGRAQESNARYRQAIEAYSNVSSLYPNEPFVLETFVQIANCWRRLEQTDKALGAVQQAQLALERLPADSDFASTTVLSREEWRMLLANMSKW